MFDGLVELVALVRLDGTILATNAAWKRVVARKEITNLDVGDDYIAFLTELAAADNPDALAILDGIADIRSGARRRLIRVFVGAGRYEGENYRLILSSFDFASEQLILISAHDISELLKLKRQRRRLGSRLLKAQEDERRRIARDLHDSTAQLLVGLQLGLSRLKQVEPDSAPDGLLADCSEAVERVQREIRAFSFICHPPSLAGEGFVPALDAMVRGFGRRASLEVQAFIEDPGELSHSIEATLYRLAQEALVNVHRHAEATHLSVWLVATGRYVHLVVKDDGRGFDPADRDASVPLGVGIAGMKERVAHLGGRLAIHRQAKGTSLVATLPRTVSN